MKHSLLPLLIGLLCWTGSRAATLTYAYDGSKTQAENGTALRQLLMQHRQVILCLCKLVHVRVTSR